MQENKAGKTKENSGKENCQDPKTREVETKVRPPPPQYHNPDPNDDGSDQGGGGGGGGGNTGWRPDRGNPIDPQVAMMAQAIGIAIANSGKRQADAPLPFKNGKDQNIKL